MQVGLIGLGPMGRNLALNLRDAGHQVITFDAWPEARSWRAQGVAAAPDLAGLVLDLDHPRLVLLMVKAGQPVTAMARELAPLLSAGDVIMDGGNSHYKDSEILSAELAEYGIGFLGIGISGGAEGARRGPAIMAGGDQNAWAKAEPLLSSIAARCGIEPCLNWFGAGGAGHFVKMVHNGIEYAVMQSIAEAAALLAPGGRQPADIAAIMDAWAKGPLAGYLVEISAEIHATIDAESGGPLIDIVADSAGQKGTGTWCCAAGLELGVPLPCIAEAVAMRQLSASGNLRRHHGPPPPYAGAQEELDPAAVADALSASITVALGQGFDLLAAAAAARDWPATPQAAARVWRNGSILRMALLDEVMALPGGTPVLAAPVLRQRVEAALGGWRQAAAWGLAHGLAIPVTAAGLAYWNGLSAARLPTALIQAQRDRFGDHGFHRTDKPGIHHGPWRRTTQ